MLSLKSPDPHPNPNHILYLILILVDKLDTVWVPSSTSCLGSVSSLVLLRLLQIPKKKILKKFGEDPKSIIHSYRKVRLKSLFSIFAT